MKRLLFIPLLFICTSAFAYGQILTIDGDITESGVITYEGFKFNTIHDIVFADNLTISGASLSETAATKTYATYHGPNSVTLSSLSSFSTGDTAYVFIKYTTGVYSRTGYKCVIDTPNIDFIDNSDSATYTLTINGSNLTTNTGSAAIYLGNDPVFANATTTVEQTTINSWSKRQVEFQVTTGALGYGTNYIYVIGDDGAVSSGYAHYINKPVVSSYSVGTVGGSNMGASGGQIKWDDGEDQANGVPLDENGWSFGVGTLTDPTYTTTAPQRTTSSLVNILSDNTTTYNSSFSVLSDFSTYYVSYWYRGVTTGNASRNVKPFGLRKDSNGGEPELRFDMHPAAGGGNLYSASTGNIQVEADTSVGNDLKDDGEWHRREFIGTIGDIYTANAFSKYYSDLVLKGNLVRHLNKLDSNGIGVAIINFYFAIDLVGTPEPSAEFWFDDVYLSQTFSRIVIGDNPRFSDCTKRELQPVDSWSASSVEITQNVTEFVDGETAYVFAIDETNSISEGFEIIINGGSPGSNTSSLTISNITIGGSLSIGNG